MADDLLTTIQRELHQRMNQLLPAVEERDRLQADLRALGASPKPPATLDRDSEPPVCLNLDPEPSAAVLCLPAMRQPEHTHAVSTQASRPLASPLRPARARLVSPKVARLMLAPRRPALERSGIPRVSADLQRSTSR